MLLPLPSPVLTMTRPRRSPSSLVVAFLGGWGFDLHGVPSEFSTPGHAGAAAPATARPHAVDGDALVKHLLQRGAWRRPARRRGGAGGPAATTARSSACSAMESSCSTLTTCSPRHQVAHQRSQSAWCGGRGWPGFVHQQHLACTASSARQQHALALTARAGQRLPRQSRPGCCAGLFDGAVVGGAGRLQPALVRQAQHHHVPRSGRRRRLRSGPARPGAGRCRAGARQRGRAGSSTRPFAAGSNPPAPAAAWTCPRHWGRRCWSSAPPPAPRTPCSRSAFRFQRLSAGAPYSYHFSSNHRAPGGCSAK